MAPPNATMFDADQVPPESPSEDKNALEAGASSNHEGSSNEEEDEEVAETQQVHFRNTPKRFNPPEERSEDKKFLKYAGTMHPQLKTNLSPERQQALRKIGGRIVQENELKLAEALEEN